ncbi:MAG: PAS domain S-box protein, partial [Rhodopila sp.]
MTEAPLPESDGAAGQPPPQPPASDQSLKLRGLGDMVLVVTSALARLASRLADVIRYIVARGWESEARLRLFIDGAPAAIAMFDTAMCYLAVSRRFLIDFGLDNETPATLAGRSHYEVFPELPERWRAIYDRVLAGESCSAEDDQFRRADGRATWLRWEMVPWRNAEDTIGGALLFAEKLTDRRIAEAALRDSEARLRLVQRVGRIAWSDRKLSDIRAMISEQYTQIYGLPPGQTYVSKTEWLALIHPEDRDREWVHAMVDSDSEYCGPIAAEFRIVRPDG